MRKAQSPKLKVKVQQNSISLQSARNGNFGFLRLLRFMIYKLIDILQNLLEIVLFVEGLSVCYHSEAKRQTDCFYLFKVKVNLFSFFCLIQSGIIFCCCYFFWLLKTVGKHKHLSLHYCCNLSSHQSPHPTHSLGKGNCLA